MRKERLYVLCTVCFAILAAGCNSVQQVLKSGRPDHMYQTALKHYQNQKWSKAAMLFEAAAPYYSGTMQEDSIAFMTAFCKFKTRDYEVATSMLDDFRRKFGRSVFLEDAEGILALSYFYLAPGPTRDQTMTTQAIVAVNEYLAHYPNSSRSDEFREMDKILTQRLHDKTYLNAYTYYKIGRYKSAIVALKNALKLYPTSSHREEIMYLIVKSGRQLRAGQAGRPLPLDARLLLLVRGRISRIALPQGARPAGPERQRLFRPKQQRKTIIPWRSRKALPPTP